MQDPKSLLVTCLTCHAAAGEPCVGDSGRELERVHWGRPHYEEIKNRRGARQAVPSGGPGPRGHYEGGKWVGESVFNVSDEQWAADHAGTCDVCGGQARLYAGGWRCDSHKPSAAKVG